MQQKDYQAAADKLKAFVWEVRFFRTGTKTQSEFLTYERLKWIEEMVERKRSEDKLYNRMSGKEKFISLPQQ